MPSQYAFRRSESPRSMCIPGLPHSWHRKSDMTWRKRRKRRRKTRSGSYGDRAWRRSENAGVVGSVHARKRHNGTLAICIHYTGARARARTRVFSPLRPVRDHHGASFSFSPLRVISSLTSFSPRSPSFSLPMMSAYVQAYTLSSAFLTEADSGMHDGPKVSLNTPPPRESTPPRVYPRQVAAPESLRAIRFPVSFTRVAWKETLRYRGRKN